ncbi:MAG: hypothetical protein ACI9XB_000411 [Gammaproteobacteria bacterium]
MGRSTLIHPKCEIHSLKGKKEAAILLKKETVEAAAGEELTIRLSKKERARIL